VFIGLPRIGSRVSWAIGKKGEAPDLYPARINDVQGRQLSLIVQRKNAEGQTYLTHVLTSTNFIEARNELVEELDSATMAQLVDQVVEERAAFEAQRATDAVVS
jgi:hypothetical protein